MTNLELLLGAAGLVWAAAFLRLAGPDRCAAVARVTGEPARHLLRPALAFVLIALLSALASPVYRLEALKFVGRLGAGLFAFVLVLEIAASPGRIAGLLWAIVLGAGLSATIGLGEVAAPSAVEPLLASFRTLTSQVGGELRTSATFEYPTIAAMFLEMAVPLALVLAATANTRPARWLALAIALVSIWTIVLTLTRASLLSLGFLFGLMLAAALTRRSWRPVAAPVALAALVMVGLVGLLALTWPTFRLRLTTENDLRWYGATYQVPDRLALDASQPVPVTVEVHNVGLMSWRAEGEASFALGYRWLPLAGEADAESSHFEIPLPRDVAPGQAIRLTTELGPSVPPGEYRLIWGMLQRQRLWFRDRDVPEAVTLVSVPPGLRFASPAAARPPVRVGPLRPPSVPRAVLWRTALGLFAERPLLGIGPDSFRRLYGRRLGLAEWDDTLHTNNLYLELLVTLGLLGLLAFGWLLVETGRALAGSLRSPVGGPAPLWALGVGGALLTFLVHGLLDYFLGFTATYLLFWMTLGLLVALARLTTSPAQSVP